MTERRSLLDSDDDVEPDLSIALLTQRYRVGGRQPVYAAIAEAEDVLVRSANAELIDLASQVSDPAIRFRRMIGGVARRSRPSTLLPPIPRSSRRRFDVVIAIMETIWDLPLLEAHPVARSADFVVVWVLEVWTAEFGDRRLEFEPYGVADHIFVGTVGVEPLLGSHLGAKVDLLTWATDVERFRPSSGNSHRPIDVLNIGRRIEPLHERLLAWSNADGRFYEYDTTVGARVVEPLRHRDRLASYYKRSSVAMTSYPKHDVEGSGGETDIPSRLWEGLAAGCAMIGRAPLASVQQELVGDVVVRELPEDLDEALLAVADLVMSSSEDERLRNTALAHRFHDWSHRWAQLFRMSGLPIPPGIDSRIQRLSESVPVSGAK